MEAGQWACPLCTYLNSAYMSICEACETEAPQDAPTATHRVVAFNNDDDDNDGISGITAVNRKRSRPACSAATADAIASALVQLPQPPRQSDPEVTRPIAGTASADTVCGDVGAAQGMDLMQRILARQNQHEQAASSAAATVLLPSDAAALPTLARSTGSFSLYRRPSTSAPGTAPVLPSAPAGGRKPTASALFTAPPASAPAIEAGPVHGPALASGLPPARALSSATVSIGFAGAGLARAPSLQPQQPRQSQQEPQPLCRNGSYLSQLAARSISSTNASIAAASATAATDAAAAAAAHDAEPPITPVSASPLPPLLHCSHLYSAGPGARPGLGSERDVVALIDTRVPPAVAVKFIFALLTQRREAPMRFSLMRLPVAGAVVFARVHGASRYYSYRPAAADAAAAAVDDGDDDDDDGDDDDDNGCSPVGGVPEARLAAGGSYRYAGGSVATVAAIATAGAGGMPGLLRRMGDPRFPSTDTAVGHSGLSVPSAAAALAAGPARARASGLSSAGNAGPGGRLDVEHAPFAALPKKDRTRMQMHWAANGDYTGLDAHCVYNYNVMLPYAAPPTGAVTAGAGLAGVGEPRGRGPSVQEWWDASVFVSPLQERALVTDPAFPPQLRQFVCPSVLAPRPVCGAAAGTCAVPGQEQTYASGAVLALSSAVDETCTDADRDANANVVASRLANELCPVRGGNGWLMSLAAADSAVRAGTAAAGAAAPRVPSSGPENVYTASPWSRLLQYALPPLNLAAVHVFVPTPSTRSIAQQSQSQRKGSELDAYAVDTVGESADSAAIAGAAHPCPNLLASSSSPSVSASSSSTVRTAPLTLHTAVCASASAAFPLLPVTPLSLADCTSWVQSVATAPTVTPPPLALGAGADDGWGPCGLPWRFVLPAPTRLTEAHAALLLPQQQKTSPAMSAARRGPLVSRTQQQLPPQVPTVMPLLVADSGHPAATLVRAVTAAAAAMPASDVGTTGVGGAGVSPESDTGTLDSAFYPLLSPYTSMSGPGAVIILDGASVIAAASTLLAIVTPDAAPAAGELCWCAASAVAPAEAAIVAAAAPASGPAPALAFVSTPLVLCPFCCARSDASASASVVAATPALTGVHSSACAAAPPGYVSALQLYLFLLRCILPRHAPLVLAADLLVAVQRAATARLHGARVAVGLPAGSVADDAGRMIEPLFHSPAAATLGLSILSRRCGVRVRALDGVAGLSAALAAAARAQSREFFRVTDLYLALTTLHAPVALKAAAVARGRRLGAASEAWFRMLIQIPQVSQARALALYSAFPTLQALRSVVRKIFADELALRGLAPVPGEWHCAARSAATISATVALTKPLGAREAASRAKKLTVARSLDHDFGLIPPELGAADAGTRGGVGCGDVWVDVCARVAAVELESSSDRRETVGPVTARHLVHLAAATARA